MRYSSACSYPLGFAQASPRCRSVRLNGDPAVKRAGVPATITPHGLRHTCASLLVDQGADPVAVQEHLGHRDVATTLRIYRHLFADRSDQLTGALDALYATAESEALKASEKVASLADHRSSR